MGLGPGDSMRARGEPARAPFEGKAGEPSSFSPYLPGLEWEPSSREIWTMVRMRGGAGWQGAQLLCWMKERDELPPGLRAAGG